MQLVHEATGGSAGANEEVITRWRLSALTPAVSCVEVRAGCRETDLRVFRQRACLIGRRAVTFILELGVGEGSFQTGGGAGVCHGLT